MILREWRGRAERTRRDAYPQHFRTAVVPDLESVDGFLGAELLVREHAAGEVEYTVLTRWASMEAIQAFAGDAVDEAVVEPGAVAALGDYDRTVRHHQVVESVPAPRAPERPAPEQDWLLGESR